MSGPSLTFVEEGPPVSKRALRALERQLGLPLPREYAAFLKARNGAVPGPNSCDLPAAQRVGVAVNCFFGVGWPRADTYDAMRLYKGRVPGRYLPIADAEGGNLICIGLGEPDDGAVYFWDHEFEAEDGQLPRTDNLHLLTDSFSDFFAHLRPLTDDDIVDGPTELRSAWIDPELLG